MKFVGPNPGDAFPALGRGPGAIHHNHSLDHAFDAAACLQASLAETVNDGWRKSSVIFMLE